jgi:hypothetical protein
MPLSKEDKKKIAKSRKVFDFLLIVIAIIGLSYITLERFKNIPRFKSLNIQEDLNFDLFNLQDEDKEIIESKITKTFSINGLSLKYPSSWSVLDLNDDALFDQSVINNSDIIFIAHDLISDSLGSTFLSVQEIKETDIEINSFLKKIVNEYENKKIVASLETEELNKKETLVTGSYSKENSLIFKSIGKIVFLEDKSYLINLFSPLNIWSQKEQIFNEVLNSIEHESEIDFNN